MADDISIERLFPILTADQIGRAAKHGRLRNVQAGAVLVEPGTPNTRLYIVKGGRLEILGPSDGDQVVDLGPGQFTGEASLLTGRRRLVRVRALEGSELVEIERDELMNLVQTDSDLSDIFMRAFILRRVALIARNLGDAVLLGSDHSRETHRIKEFLTRNGHPYA